MKLPPPKIELPNEVRENLGKLVRQTWIDYCRENGNSKPSHIAPWEYMSDWDKEADRVIGEVIWNAAFDSAIYGLSTLKQITRPDTTYEGPAPSIRRGPPRDPSEAPPNG